MSYFSSPKSYIENLPDSCSKTIHSGGNVVYGSHNQIYRDLIIVKSLTKAKFPVYLVTSKITKKDYAMKVFGYENRQPHLYFKNETRFACLQHPNVVRNLFFEPNRKAKFEGDEMQISYTIMEYAQHGDFFSFLKNHHHEIDDKLVRTYFRQLIDGLEYLHNNDVAHMDLKLENLLLSNDFLLKIADFDMAHFKEDAIIISNGTKYYRAPEVMKGKCNIPKMADIFSAGVILFTLKTKGIFPQFESNEIEGILFSDLLYNDTSEFWARHRKVQKLSEAFFDEDFKDLFTVMTKFNPDERASIQDIKNSKWYNGPIYSPEELVQKVSRIFFH